MLPFDNMSGDADLGYFSDGMTEDIIPELSKNSDLKVVSRLLQPIFVGWLGINKS